MMNVVVKWSVVLAVLVTVLTGIIILSGLHQNPMGGLVHLVLVIVIDVLVVFLALRQTAAEKAYGGQLANGVMIGLVGGILVFLGSWLMLAVVFPDALDQTRDGYIAWMEAAGVPEAQLELQREQLENKTPLTQSVPGLIGTFFTSTLAAAVIAIFRRKR